MANRYRLLLNRKPQSGIIIREFSQDDWHGGVNVMGIQLREFATWARNRKIMATLMVTLTLAIGMLIGTVISGHVGASHPAAGITGTPLAIPDPLQLSSAFASIVSKVQPAVVNISTTQVIERGKEAPSGHNREQMGPD